MAQPTDNVDADFADLEIGHAVTMGSDRPGPSSGTMTMADLSQGIVSFGYAGDFARPCVDCGERTGNFCETPAQQGYEFWQGGVCLAETWVPSEDWAENQRTPLCTRCEGARGACHYCLKIHWCTPPEVLARQHKAERTRVEEQAQRQRLGPEAAAAAQAQAERWHFIDVVD